MAKLRKPRRSKITERLHFEMDSPFLVLDWSPWEGPPALFSLTEMKRANDYLTRAIAWMEAEEKKDG